MTVAKIRAGSVSKKPTDNVQANFPAAAAAALAATQASEPEKPVKPPRTSPAPAAHKITISAVVSTAFPDHFRLRGRLSRYRW